MDSSSNSKTKRTPVKSGSESGPIRLSKLMAEKGLCSRREADHYIEKGMVYVNGQRITTLGTKVDPDSRVTLDTRALESQKNLATILLNKPIGYVSSQPEDDYEPAVKLIQPETHFGEQKRKLDTRDFDGLAVAGRLDIDSQGLLIFTQDGRLAKDRKSTRLYSSHLVTPYAVFCL